MTDFIKRSESVWKFGPSPKIAPLSSRTLPPELTEQRVRKVLARIPITRICDLTPLDELGLPVFTVVTPLARDLTSQMGKGPDAISARVSALMEAVERISAETAPPGATLEASWEELTKEPGRCPVDPDILQLPSDSLYAADRTFTWIDSHELLADTPVLMPTDLALSPPVEGILREVDTNGLASGNSRLEAIVHALCEVIERDTESQLEFISLFADSHDPWPLITTVDPATLPEAAGFWAERIRSAGLDIVIHDITGDIEVATFRTIIIDYHYPGPAGSAPLRFGGWGTAPNAEVAVIRSITEAVQSRLAFIQGGSDSYNTTPISKRATTRDARRRQISPVRRVPFSRTPSYQASDLLDDLTFLLDRLSASGVQQVIATDLTRPDLGIPVVRIRVPGLSSFHVNRRRVDWRCLRHLL